MNEYHKIHTMFKRDMSNGNGGKLLFGEWVSPELEYLANNDWEFTEKVDGTNIRVMWDGDTVRFGGKTDRANIPAKLLANLQDTFPAEAFSIFDGPVCLYGEGHGPGIQKNGGNYGAEQTFVLFDVKIGRWWLKRLDVIDVAEKMGIRVVPMIGRGSLFHAIQLVEDGLTSLWGQFEAEGIVARPAVELVSRSGERIITKIKARDFA